MDWEGLKVQTTSPCATSNFGSLRQKERIPTSSGYFHFSNDSSLANVSFWFWKEVRVVQQWLSIDAGHRLIVLMPCRFVYMHPKTMTWPLFLIRDSSLRPLMSYKASVISKYQVAIFYCSSFPCAFFIQVRWLLRAISPVKTVSNIHRNTHISLNFAVLRFLKLM